MGNAEFKQLQMGEGTPGLVLHVVLGFILLAWVEFKAESVHCSGGSVPPVH